MFKKRFVKRFRIFIQTKSMQNENCGIKEFDYRFKESKPTITLPINYFSVKSKTKPETLLYNINVQVNSCDTSNIDFTYGGTNNNTFKPLSKRFCDNIILYFELPKETINNNKVLQEYVNKADNNNTETTDNTDSDTWINKLLKEIAPFLAENTEKIKRIFNTLGIQINKTHIKPTRPAHENNTIRQYIKVSLPDIDIELIYNLITNATVIDVLNKEGIFIHDIDFTQDFHGVINKESVIHYLLKQPNFRMQGDFPEEIEDINLQDTCTILSNDCFVGKNCLTFISKSTFGTVRYKFYNKFVQSIESPSVRGKVGNHYSDWIDNPEQILKQSISKCVETGLLRLEITFYIQNCAVTQDYINKHLDYLTNLLPPNLLYYNSIPNQWKLIQSAIKYNLLILDLDNNLGLYSYSINKCTKKINGFFIKDISTNKISNLIKLYSFNTPIIVLSIRRSFDNLLIQQTTLEKKLINNVDKRFVMEELETYLTTGSKYFFPKKSLNANPETTGLIDSPIVRLRTQRSKCIGKLITGHVPIILREIDNIPLEFPNDKVTTIAKKYKEEQSEKLFIESNKDLIETLNKENNKTKESAAQEQLELIRKREELLATKEKEAKLLNHITNSFDIPHSNKKKLIELPDKTHLYIYAIKFITTKYGNTVLIATSTQTSITTESPLDVYWGVKSILDYTNLHKEMWQILNYNMYGSAFGRPIMEIEKDGFYYNKSRNKCALINVVDCKETSGEAFVHSELTEITIRRIIREELPENEFLLKHTYINTKSDKIDNLVKEGDVIEVFNTFSYRNSNLVEFKIRGKEDIISAKSNKFLDDIIVGKENRFSIVAGIVKTHPVSKRKCISFKGA
ncbi:hypothetical protein M9Y10_036247 [Tritrichomonas musculus]|uniref:Uncharacterized protein n=1 Tax=Tritrichomonas musculus TaxID=1915356 RepID=A0ABR2GUU9_9EUKA